MNSCTASWLQPYAVRVIIRSVPVDRPPACGTSRLSSVVLNRRTTSDMESKTTSTRVSRTSSSVPGSHSTLSTSSSGRLIVEIEVGGSGRRPPSFPLKLVHGPGPLVSTARMDQVKAVPAGTEFSVQYA